MIYIVLSIGPLIKLGALIALIQSILAVQYKINVRKIEVYPRELFVLGKNILKERLKH